MNDPKLDKIIKMNTKSVKLRAFRISQTSELTSDDSALISLLQQVLTSRSIVQDRSMRLNQNENEEDVMPFFKWNSEKSFVFGLVMRVLKNDITQGIPSEFYNRDSFSISDIDGTEGIDTCKSFYYIALNKDFLITNLRGNLPVNRVEAYLNFLVKEQRRVIYSFTPVMTIPEGFPLYKIKKNINRRWNFIANINRRNWEYDKIIVKRCSFPSARRKSRPYRVDEKRYNTSEFDY